MTNTPNTAPGAMTNKLRRAILSLELTATWLDGGCDPLRATVEIRSALDLLRTFLAAHPSQAQAAEAVDRYRKALYQIAYWTDGGNQSGQNNIQKYAISILDGDPPVGELSPHDALRYTTCRASAIERGLFTTPEEYDAMVDDSLRKNGKEVLTGRGNNFGKKVAKDGSLYRAPRPHRQSRATSAMYIGQSR